MPRIESGSSSSGEGFSLPFKLITLGGLIACGIGYMVYQYERLHPAAKPAVAIKKLAPEQKKEEVFAKLDLTDDQKSKIASLESQTTDPRQLHRDAYKLLTEEQKAHLKNLKAEADAKRDEQKARREARMIKLYPGNQRQVADALNKQAHERQQQRRAATQAAAPTPATN